MKLNTIPWLLLPLALATAASAIPPPTREKAEQAAADALDTQSSPANAAAAPAEASTAQGEASIEESTIFNGVSVPPMKDLTGEKFEEDVKDGYWFVKHFSPYCPHCKEIAPTWQTLYEFYYTSEPVASSSKTPDKSVSLNSFHGFYDFHFASLDCVAWGDACSDHGVTHYPTFIIYKSGEVLKRFSGKKDMQGLSDFVEDTLESIKPGSRSPKGLHLPLPGANSIEQGTSKSASNIEKDKNAAGGAAAGKAHNEMASSATAKRPTASTKAAALSPTTTPNPGGNSVELTHETFQKLVTNSREPWFIKFYAPWCHHCQALAPTWEHMARELQGDINVGAVNCDAEKRLCKDVGVRAYPTIHFFRGGERVEYDGLRGLGDLVKYAKSALDVGQDVLDVDLVTFNKMEETEEVIFVYFYDHATTMEDFEALDRLTLSLVGHAKLVKTDSKVLADRYKIHTWPRLIVSRDGRPSYFTPLAPKDIRDFRKVLNWMQSVWLPIVPELTISNSKEVMNHRYVVLGVLSRERSDEFLLNKREIKNAAFEWMDRETHAFQLERQELRDSKQLKIEEAGDRDDERALRSAKQTRVEITEQDRQQVGFAWVDGVFWERWLRTTYGVDIADGERVVINDQDNKRYWDTTISGASIVPSRTSILETLKKITQDPPAISPKYTTNRVVQVFLKGKSIIRSHPTLSVMFFVAALFLAATYGRRKTRRSRGVSVGFFNLDGKDGLLGGNGAGKVD